LHRSRSVVTFPLRGLAGVVLRNDHAPAVRVEQDLGGVEPKSTRGGRSPLDPVAIDLSRQHAWHEYVPVVVCAVRNRIDLHHTGRGGVILPVEDEEFDARGGSREQTEVDATVGDSGAEGGASPDELSLHHDCLKYLHLCSRTPGLTPEKGRRSSTRK